MSDPFDRWAIAFGVDPDDGDARDAWHAAYKRGSEDGYSRGRAAGLEEAAHWHDSRAEYSGGVAWENHKYAAQMFRDLAREDEGSSSPPASDQCPTCMHTKNVRGWLDFDHSIACDNFWHDAPDCRGEPHDAAIAPHEHEEDNA